MLPSCMRSLSIWSEIQLRRSFSWAPAPILLEAGRWRWTSSIVLRFWACSCERSFDFCLRSRESTPVFAEVRNREFKAFKFSRRRIASSSSRSLRSFRSRLRLIFYTFKISYFFSREGPRSLSIESSSAGAAPRLPPVKFWSMGLLRRGGAYRDLAVLGLFSAGAEAGPDCDVLAICGGFFVAPLLRSSLTA